jgi:hypothetical protein
MSTGALFSQREKVPPMPALGALLTLNDRSPPLLLLTLLDPLTQARELLTCTLCTALLLTLLSWRKGVPVMVMTFGLHTKVSVLP